MSNLFPVSNYAEIYKNELLGALNKGMDREGDSNPQTQDEIIEIIKWIKLTGVSDPIVRDCIFEKIRQTVKNPITIEMCKRIYEGLNG